MSEKVPDQFIDKDKYIQARNHIKKLIPKHSAWRSMKIVDYYKNQLNGRIKEDKNKSTLRRWLEEEWINFSEYMKGNKVKCGDPKFIDKSACRPLKRISKETPITADEVLKKHSKQLIKKQLEIKNNNPQNIILDWKNMRTIRKKN